MARINHNGRTHKERELNYGIKNFEKYLSEHPSAEKVDIDDVNTDASIISNKQDQFKLTKEILVRLGTDIHPGSLVEWHDEYWLVYQRVIQPNEAYITCYMVKCNYIVNWLDEFGVQHSQHAYILSSKDNMVKSNFRTWNRLITPQPNQYLEMLVPKSPIHLGQKFIVSERAWFVVEYDDTSAPGITYYSLTETKVDRMDDSVEEELANVNKRGQWNIVAADADCLLGGSVVVPVQVFQDGFARDNTYTITIEDESIATYSDGLLHGVSLGTTTGHIVLNDNAAISTVFSINVAEQVSASYQFLGATSIKIAHEEIYSIIDEQTGAILPIESFEISDNLATCTIVDGKLIVRANEENKLGVVQLKVVTAKGEFSKSISIRSLW